MTGDKDTEDKGKAEQATSSLKDAGETIKACRTCDQTVHGPPLNTHCAVLDGPATVRI